MVGVWFLCMALSSIYKPSFISTPFSLNKIWAGQATTMKTWLRGDNYVNIQGRIMVLVHCLPSHSLSIYKPSFISIPFVLSKIWPRQASIMKNGYGEITQ